MAGCGAIPSSLRNLERGDAIARGVEDHAEPPLGLGVAIPKAYFGQYEFTSQFEGAERIAAERALAIGLVGDVVPLEELDACVGKLVDALLAGGPLAQKAAKELIAAVDGQKIDEIISEETARRIARQRATDEAKDGIAAFLDKRPPAWLV